VGRMFRGFGWKPKEIKDPRPKGRGISEQRELALLVQLPVA
jgi:hypothetical protein